MVDFKGLGAVPSPGIKADHRDDGDPWGGQGMRISPGGGGNGSRSTLHHRRLHQETTSDYSGKVGLPPHL